MVVYFFRDKAGELQHVTTTTIIDAFVLALDHLKSGQAVPFSIVEDGCEFDQQAIFRVYRHVPTP